MIALRLGRFLVAFGPLLALGCAFAAKQHLGGPAVFGNSGWDGELAIALVRAGLVEGEIDEDGYLDGADFGRAEALVLSAIESLNDAPAAAVDHG